MRKHITRRQAIKAGGEALAVAGATIIAFPIIAQAGSPKAILPMTADEREILRKYRGLTPEGKAVARDLFNGLADRSNTEVSLAYIQALLLIKTGGAS